jgi:hypothetical protein
MAEKNLVEETLIQIQNLEEVINENAKEILASTMKEEISELVKESMKDETKEESEEPTDEVTEADEDEFMAMDDEESEEEEEESEDEESEEEEESDEDEFMGFEEEEETDFDSEMGTQSLVDEPDSVVMDVFLKAGPEDEFIVQKDGDYLHVTDKSADREYLVQTESEEEEFEYELEEGSDEENEYELEEGDNEEFEYELEEDENEKEQTEVVYELELEEGDTEFEFELEEGDEYELEESSDEENESYNHMMESKKTKKMETKESMKPKVGKGAQTGSAKKFSYKTSKGGFKDDMKHASPTKGTGKPKFEFKEAEIMDMPSRTPKLSKEEAKEAARTYGMGWRKGALPKGARTGSKKARQDESVMGEVEMLRTKNEEYRKALNLFRDKLNEVAIFNSNLAYATRLFTEHSTSKQEKINILRRFDSAETLKESKALYKTIKDELSQGTKSAPITESIERVIDREPQSGSAINLIESKTYENPQFLRMKDIMSKIAK